MLKYGLPPNHRAQSFPCRSVDDVVGSEVQRVHVKNHRPHERVSCSNRNVTSKDMLPLPLLACNEGDIGNWSFTKVRFSLHFIMISLACRGREYKTYRHLHRHSAIPLWNIWNWSSCLTRPITTDILMRNRTTLIERIYHSTDEDVVKKDMISFTTISLGHHGILLCECVSLTMDNSGLLVYDYT